MTEKQTVKVSVILPKKHLHKLKAMAYVHGATVSSLIRLSVDLFISFPPANENHLYGRK